MTARALRGRARQAISRTPDAPGGGPRARWSAPRCFWSPPLARFVTGQSSWPTAASERSRRATGLALREGRGLRPYVRPTMDLSPTEEQTHDPAGGARLRRARGRAERPASSTTRALARGARRAPRRARAHGRGRAERARRRRSPTTSPTRSRWRRSARACASVGVIMSVNNSLVCDPILRFGNDEQKKRYPRAARVGPEARLLRAHRADRAARTRQHMERPSRRRRATAGSSTGPRTGSRTGRTRT